MNPESPKKLIATLTLFAGTPALVAETGADPTTVWIATVAAGIGAFYTTRGSTEGDRKLELRGSTAVARFQLAVWTTLLWSSWWAWTVLRFIRTDVDADVIVPSVGGNACIIWILSLVALATVQRVERIERIDLADANDAAKLRTPTPLLWTVQLAMATSVTALAFSVSVNRAIQAPTADFRHLPTLPNSMLLMLIASNAGLLIGFLMTRKPDRPRT